MAAIFVGILCLINLFLWFLFFKKFNKLFSTQDIIENTKSELNKMILDVNRNAYRNITLIEARISDLKAAIAEADTRLTLIKKQKQVNTFESALQSEIKTVINNDRSVPSRVAQAYKKNTSTIKSDDSFELVSNNPQKNAQKTLFDMENNENEKKQVTITEEGSAYTDIPLLNPKVYMSDDPIVVKKSFNDEVKDRYLKGESIEQIATELSRSVTEVQFVLDLSE